MTAINKINRILLELLISVLFTLVALQTVYAGGLEDDSNNTIIVTADGIAKVIENLLLYRNTTLQHYFLLRG